MKLLKYTFIISLVTLLSCQIDEIQDPNNPSVIAIENNASRNELQLLVSGVESEMRDEMGFYYDVLGIIGREYYFFTNSDPRYTGEVLGKGEATLDDAGFYGTRPYAGRYKVVKDANILMTAAQNAADPLSDSELKGFTGFAKTTQAYSLLLVLNMQYQNGIRIEVSDPENLGPFKDYSTALGDISSLLDAGYADLNTAGSEALFFLSEGFVFNGLDELESLKQFNRAIKARVELYRGNKTAALSALSDSFFDLAGSLNMGPSHFYDAAGTDLPNPVYRTPNGSEALAAQPSYVTDIRAGDDRINKVAMRTSPATLDGLTSNYDVVIYSSISSNIPIIRNEELILIYAEANIGTNNTEAASALSIITSAHGLGNYTGALTDSELVDELLYNRRYSLFGEAHRWIDMRRYDRLDQLPIDRPGDDVWTQLPRPVSEIGVQGG
ncbi:MAG TPA: RagB/SusD family nutrient uptake outer membrane protein [Fulvivirga sp.]|nr:RagB/SusD family nutrient uptake outer membrane protein [Fulvivirga sp.]